MCIHVYYIYVYIYIYMGKFDHDLTVLPNPGIMAKKGNHPQMAARFRLVKYYNLPRYSIHIYIYIYTHLCMCVWGWCQFISYRGWNPKIAAMFQLQWGYWLRITQPSRRWWCTLGESNIAIENPPLNDYNWWFIAGKIIEKNGIFSSKPHLITRNVMVCCQ